MDSLYPNAVSRSDGKCYASSVEIPCCAFAVPKSLSKMYEAKWGPRHNTYGQLNDWIFDLEKFMYSVIDTTWGARASRDD